MRLYLVLLLHYIVFYGEFIKQLINNCFFKKKYIDNKLKIISYLRRRCIIFIYHSDIRRMLNH